MNAAANQGGVKGTSNQSRINGSRGKSLASVIEQKFRYKDNEKYAGAIKPKKYVLAIDRQNQWKVAQILEVREEKDVINGDEAEWWDPQDLNENENATMEVDDPEKKQEGEDTERAKTPVEYYVHYLEVDRLFDRWVKENMVQINDEIVEILKEDWEQRHAEEEKRR